MTLITLRDVTAQKPVSYKHHVSSVPSCKSTESDKKLKSSAYLQVTSSQINSLSF